MRHYAILSFGLTLVGCGGNSGKTPAGPVDASGADVTVDAHSGKDVSVPDDTGKARTQVDSGGDGAGDDSSKDEDGGTPLDSGGNDTSRSDSGDDGASEEGSFEASCPATWLEEPSVNAMIAVPTDGGVVLLHAAGTGTQNYTCTLGSDGGPAWTLTGPTAELNDCNDAGIGHHFASEGGAAYPEWQTSDGTYVIGHKLDSFTPDGGADSVPWLLLQAVSVGGTGILSESAYIQRLDTDGGDPPASECEAGAMLQIPYSADYYFYGP